MHVTPMKRTLEPEVMDDAAEAAAYDAMDHRRPNHAFADRVTHLLGDRREKSLQVLDIGTGNGLIPLLLAERLGRAAILGIDLSHAMLAFAEEHRGPSPHRERVQFAIADANALAMGDGSFDAVVSNTILHHIADPRLFLREAWRVLQPGGVLVIRDLFRPETVGEVEALVARHAGGETAESQQLLRQSLHAAFTPNELRDIIAELGWQDVQVIVDSDRHVTIQTAGKRV